LPGSQKSWDITYLLTTVRGIWLYLYLVIDVWSRKVIAWDLAKREEPVIAADLVSRCCLRERISKGRSQTLILYAVNANGMRAQRWRAAWKNWSSSDLSQSHGCRTTTRIQNRCSGKQCTGLINRAGDLPAGKRPTNGSRLFGLLKPPAPPQRHQVRDPPTAS